MCLLLVEDLSLSVEIFPTGCHTSKFMSTAREYFSILLQVYCLEPGFTNFSDMSRYDTMFDLKMN